MGVESCVLERLQERGGVMGRVGGEGEGEGGGGEGGEEGTAVDDDDDVLYNHHHQEEEEARIQHLSLLIGLMPQK